MRAHLLHLSLAIMTGTSSSRNILKGGYGPFILLFAAIAAVYGRALAYDFSPMDEHWLFVKRMNAFFDLSSIRAFFTESVLLNYYRPVWTTSFMLDVLIGGGRPWVFHLMNAVYHFAASALFFRLLLKLNLSKNVSLLAALIFAVHPVHVHAVAWIPGRNDVLLALFGLASLLLFISYLDKKKAMDLVLSLFFFVVSLFTKESAIVIPVIAAIYFFIFRQNEPQKSLLAFLGACIVVTIPWLLLRHSIVPVYPKLLEGGALFRIKDAFLALIVFTGKIFLPAGQSVMPTMEDTNVLPFAVIVILFLGACYYWGFVNKKVAVFGFAWFIVFLGIPLLSGSAKGSWEHYEHRAYLPAMGLLIAVSQLNVRKLQFLGAPRLISGFVIVVIAAFGIKAFVRTQIYEDARTFLKAGIDEAPHTPYFYQAMGELLTSEKKYSEAIACYDRYIVLNPNKAIVYSDRGATYAFMRDFRKALENYQQAIRLEPNRADFLEYRATAEFSLGMLDSAAKDMDVMKKMGGHADPRFEQTLARALEIRGYMNDYKKYSACAASDTATHYSYNMLGISLFMLNRYREALHNFNIAIRQKPNEPHYLFNRGMTYEALGETDSAYYDYNKLPALGLDFDKKVLEEMRQKLGFPEGK